MLARVPLGVVAGCMKTISRAEYMRIQQELAFGQKLADEMEATIAETQEAVRQLREAGAELRESLSLFEIAETVQ
jgi:hypothetical protein